MKHLVTVMTFLSILLMSTMAVAVNVTIDPGEYVGGYLIDNQGYGGINEFDLEPGQYQVNLGDQPNAIRFEVTGNGTISTTSTRVALDSSGTTIHFLTVPVYLDPAAYQGGIHHRGKGLWRCSNGSATSGRNWH